MHIKATDWATNLTSSHLISPHLTSSHLISPHLTSSHLISPHLTSSHLISPHLTSSHLISPHLTSSHLISPHLISSHLISSHLISSHLISSHLISSHLISSHLISSHLLISSHPISSHLISSHLISSHLISSHLISSHLISSHLISSHLISSHLISSHLISSHLISSHLISSHLISSHLISSHLISSHLISSSSHLKLISSHLISSHLISSHLISSHLISSHLISSHLISSHLISSHLISSHLICVRNAHQGDGLGNQFLSNIRGVDVILQVLRCFSRDDVSHVEASVDPVRDMALIENELILADLAALEKRIQVVSGKKAKKDMPISPEKELAILKQAEEVLSEGELLSRVRWGADAYDLLRKSQLLTIKPLGYVCNVNPSDLGEGGGHNNEFVRAAKARFAEIEAKLAADQQAAAAQTAGSEEKLASKKGGGKKASNANQAEDQTELSEQPGSSKIHYAVLSASFEEEVVNELDSAAAQKEYREAHNVSESGLDMVAGVCYDLLGIHSYYTLGPEEARSWRVPRGATALQGAAKIHSDIAAGFICAEICNAEEYLRQGQSVTKRKEGKTYVLRDGDIVLYRFNVTKHSNFSSSFFASLLRHNRCVDCIRIRKIVKNGFSSFKRMIVKLNNRVITVTCAAFCTSNLDK
eukprot:g66526.t1